MSSTVNFFLEVCFFFDFYSSTKVFFRGKHFQQRLQNFLDEILISRCNEVPILLKLSSCSLRLRVRSLSISVTEKQPHLGRSQLFQVLLSKTTCRQIIQFFFKSIERRKLLQQLFCFHRTVLNRHRSFRLISQRGDVPLDKCIFVPQKNIKPSRPQSTPNSPNATSHRFLHFCSIPSQTWFLL